jgi:hypothetical protein
VVLETVGAARRGLMERRRTRAAEPLPEPEAVATGRATIVLAGEEVPDAAAGESWLGARRDVAVGQAEVAGAVAVLNRAIEAHRVAAADPHVHEVSPGQALVARVGYGRGDQVAEGRWTAAVTVPAPGGRRRRAAALRPQERVAALLAGRDRVLACEELVLRARADLDRGRPREAALELRVALEAGLAELAEVPDVPDMPERLAELRDRREAVAEAANAAVRGELSGEQRDAVDATVERLAAALRARTAAGA